MLYIFANFYKNRVEKRYDQTQIIVSDVLELGE